MLALGSADEILEFFLRAAEKISMPLLTLIYYEIRIFIPRGWSSSRNRSSAPG